MLAPAAAHAAIRKVATRPRVHPAGRRASYGDPHQVACRAPPNALDRGAGPNSPMIRSSSTGEDQMEAGRPVFSPASTSISVMFGGGPAAR